MMKTTDISYAYTYYMNYNEIIINVGKRFYTIVFRYFDYCYQ